MSLLKPWTWFGSEDRERRTYDEERSDVDVSSPSRPVTMDELREGVVLEGSTREQNRMVIEAIQEDLDYLDEAPVPVFDATPMIPSVREGPNKTWPMTRVFLPTHYGSVLWKHVYVFYAERLGNFEHDWILVDDSESARIVLGEANHDIDPMEYLSNG